MIGRRSTPYTGGGLRDGSAITDGAANGSLDSAEDRTLVAEADLSLRRVHVHVDLVGWNGDIENGDGAAADGQHALVRLLDGERERAVLHPATVHIETDVVARRAMDAGIADDATHTAGSFVSHC